MMTTLTRSPSPEKYLAVGEGSEMQIATETRLCRKDAGLKVVTPSQSYSNCSPLLNGGCIGVQNKRCRSDFLKEYAVNLNCC